MSVPIYTHDVASDTFIGGIMGAMRCDVYERDMGLLSTVADEGVQGMSLIVRYGNPMAFVERVMEINIKRLSASCAWLYTGYTVLRGYFGISDKATIVQDAVKMYNDLEKSAGRILQLIKWGDALDRLEA